MRMNSRADKIRTASENPPAYAPHGTGQYWASRRWYYDLIYGHRKIISSETVEPAKSAGRWASKGKSDCAEIIDPDPAVCRALLRGKMIGGGLFYYDNKKITVRPMARRLLEVLWLARGRSVSVAKISRHLWGRPFPPTFATLRTQVHRANIALRSARCPLFLRVCRDHILFTPTPLKFVHNSKSA